MWTGEGEEKRKWRALPGQASSREVNSNAPIFLPSTNRIESQGVCNEVHSMRTGWSQQNSVSHMCLYFARRGCWRRKHVQDFRDWPKRVSRDSLGHWDSFYPLMLQCVLKAWFLCRSPAVIQSLDCLRYFTSLSDYFSWKNIYLLEINSHFSTKLTLHS